MEQVGAHITSLRTAVPYIRAYAGRTFVVKLSGRLCDPGPLLANLADQLALLTTLGVRVVVVHGGGDQITALSQRLGLTPEIVAGRRVTDAATLGAVKMSLAGVVNTDLVAAFRGCGVSAVGLTGIDAALVDVIRRPVQTISDPSTGRHHEVDFGFVGNIVGVRPELIEHLLAARYVPVIASLAADRAGQVFNVNADTFAAQIATSLRAVKYFLLTNVDGVMGDVRSPQSLIPYMDLSELDALVKSGAISGGMLPKLAACADALRGGVQRVHIVNGTLRDSLLAEVFTNEGCGTMLVSQRDNDAPISAPITTVSTAATAATRDPVSA